MYYTQEQIDHANQADLVSFLQSQGEQLTRAGNEYRWKRHDSLTIRGNKWYRHSQRKGGAPVDFVMEFFGKSFTEAVEVLTGEKGAAPPPDRPSPAPISDFRLPPRSPDNRIARNYLTAARRLRCINYHYRAILVRKLCYARNVQHVSGKVGCMGAYHRARFGRYQRSKLSIVYIALPVRCGKA